jgi:nucleotide-binding universal stress UspA family protein
VFELGTDGPKSILVAVDGSDTSMRAAAYAAGLARRQACELLVVYVHTPGSLAAMRPETMVGMAQANAETVSQLRQAITENTERVGVAVRLIEREGDPGTEIAKVADELRVDAVIVGASTQLGHRFIGALGIHLVRLAHWPVTVVP